MRQRTILLNVWAAVAIIAGMLFFSAPKVLAVQGDCQSTQATSSTEVSSAPECDPPVDPCVADPTLPECQPPDPCIADPTLPQCQPPDPCVADPTLPQCLPVDDGDGVPAPVEDAAVTADGTSVAGDNNFDGIIDSTQSNVATLPNPNDQQAPGSFVSLEVLPTTVTLPGGDPVSQVIWNITSFNPVSPTTLEGGPPAGETFPVGMFSLTLAGLPSTDGAGGLADVYTVLQSLCLPDAVPIDGIDCAVATQLLDQLRSVKVRLIFDRVIDHSDWTVQKFLGGSFANYDAVVQDEVIGFLRTTITWTLVDGGAGDADGMLNALITDPIGPAIVPAVAVTPAVVTSTPPVVSVAAVKPKTALANTGTNMFISLIAVFLIGASLVVVRNKKQTA